MPSSPPVTPESCDARTRNALANAKVIIAKKIARTRKLSSPMSIARIQDSDSAATRSDGHLSPTRPEPVERYRDAIPSNAEEHGLGEGDDAGIAKQEYRSSRQA